jgi:hypothetical protein
MVSPLGEPEIFPSTLNSVDPPTVALSQALALLLPANSESWLGTTLNLTVAPTAGASQRIIEAGPTSLDTQATALGLGFGDSRFLPSFFSTPGLTVVSGGGFLLGSATATASAAGNNDAQVSADATNIGIANSNYLARSLETLRIGTQNDPFQASATASSRSLLPTSTPLSELPAAELQANSLVRGLEGEGDSTAPQPTFYGQPNAYVQASATLALDPASISTASASADAAGIENYTVYGGTNTPNRIARATDPALEIGGHAASNWNLQGSAASLAQPVQVSGNAIGIQQSTIYGAPRATTLITGSALADLRSALPATGMTFTAPVQAIGINQSSITAGLGTRGCRCRHRQHTDHRSGEHHHLRQHTQYHRLQRHPEIRHRGCHWYHVGFRYCQRYNDRHRRSQYSGESGWCHWSQLPRWRRGGRHDQSHLCPQEQYQRGAGKRHHQHWRRRREHH